MSSDQTKQLKQIAEKALAGAKKRGVKDVRISTYRSRNVSMLYRKGRPDKVSESSQRNLSLYLYIDGRYTACETNDLRDDALNNFLDSSVTLCKAMKPDPYRVIPDPALYEGRQETDLALFDPSIAKVTPADRHEYAAALEKATLDESGKRAISVEASYDDTESEIYQLHSNGFEGTKKGTQYWSYSEVALQDEGDKKPSGYSVAGARSRADLEKPEQVAKRTAEVAMARLGASKIETQKLPMIVENKTVSRILGRLMGAVSGRALQQKTTFLEGMVGKKIGSKVLDLVDDPFVPGGFGSRLFDSEGISAKKMPIFENGVLRNFYIDTYYGKKLDMPPTTGGSSNLVLTPGTKSLDQLVADMNKGILVRGFIGGNSNTTTGDFSLGVYGTLIEKGKLTRAVSEMNISGNHKDVWNRLVAVGNDPYPYSTYRVPSLVFDELQFAGA
ncbi:MAG: TldD/PmbA family protein [Deltaproteobacteria bacterium]|nr:TldD/PmbA family protein [Deltaproteobacteria bacterium]